ncbi:MAG: radical SAM family heme chaperone HemW [Pseudothermotoga sp.]
MSRSENLGIYVHVPFCKSRCSYCDFVSYTDFSYLEAYFNSLYKEIEMWSETLGRQKVDSVYIGGGTPSDLPLEYIRGVMCALHRDFDLKDPEITVEINPNSSCAEDLKKLGVNRLSIGLQAADDVVLKAVRRRHTVADFERTYETVSAYFDNINVDFIVGLPQETDLTIERDLEIIEDYKPKHVSVYIIETHSESMNRLHVDTDITAIHHEIFIKELERRGYDRYEISNFCVPGYRCRHNLKYWHNDNYIGVGVSAGGHIGSRRYVNVSDLHRYVEKIKNNHFPFEYSHENEPLDELRETLFMSLRLSEGVEIEKLKELAPTIDVQRLAGMFPAHLILDRGRLRMSKLGMDFSCAVLSEVIDINTLSRVTGGE